MTLKTKIEKLLDEARRKLAAAKSSQEIVAAGSGLADLVVEIEAQIDAIDEEIAAEAESIDRKKTNDLRAEKSLASDLLTDAEYLARRVDERRRAAVTAESEKLLLDASRRAEAIRAEIYGVVLAAAPAMQTLLKAASSFEVLRREFQALNTQIEAGGRADLKVPHYWKGLSLGGADKKEDFEAMFEFLWPDGHSPHLPTPEVVAAPLLTAAERIRTQTK